MAHADDDPVIFGYGSSRNISFNGTEEQGITWREWREMTEKECEDMLREYLFELVDVYVEDDE